MNQKKLVLYFTTIVILLLAPVPILNTFILFFNDNVKSQSFNKKNLFSTDNIEGHINYFFYKTYKISLNKKQVIVGKDDFLFLGNNSNKVIDKTQGKYAYTFDEINTWTDKLKNIQTWYEDKGIRFAIIIAPNKHTVYRDKLPDWIHTNNKTITDDILKLSLEKSINILDLRNILKEQKNTQLYYITDTHWNRKAASIGYDETIKYVNHIYGLKYIIPKYDLSINHRESGDLAGLLKINSLLPNNYEEDYSFNFENESNVCHGNIDKNHKLEKCVDKINPEINIHNQDQYIINTYAKNNEKLLLLCDSFGLANSKLYNETFNTIWKFHYDHINGNKLSNFIIEHKPDIVIYQVVERSLYDIDIVKSISKNK